MSAFFNCKLCDKIFKIKTKKKHLNSQYHESLSMSIISRYSIANPDFLHIVNILKNYVLEYNKEFAFYLVMCRGKYYCLS